MKTTLVVLGLLAFLGALLFLLLKGAKKCCSRGGNILYDDREYSPDGDAPIVIESEEAV